MRTVYIALLTALVGLAVSCSAGTVTKLAPDNHGKVISTDPGYDSPDYIFYDGEGAGDSLE